MHEWNTAMERDQSGRQNRRGIALRDDAGRVQDFQAGVQAFDGAGHHLHHRCTRARDLDALIDSDTEILDCQIEQVGMLTHSDHIRACPAAFAQAPNDRRHFDGLGTSADDAGA